MSGVTRARCATAGTLTVTWCGDSAELVGVAVLALPNGRSRAIAVVIVDEIGTGESVLARAGGTVVNVGLARGARVTGQTGTRTAGSGVVGSGLIDTSTKVLARVVHTSVNIGGCTSAGRVGSHVVRDGGADSRRSRDRTCNAAGEG